MSERDERIVRQRRSGMSYAEIGRLHGITGGRVRQIIRKHAPYMLASRRGEFRPFTPAEAKYVVMAFGAGRSYGQIAERLGRTRNSVAGFCVRSGLRRAGAA